MHNVAELAVLRSIEAMRNRLDEQLTIDELARVAMFSKFHFTRVFTRMTGTSPARFLSALRLQRAKELLLAGSMNVADIGSHVGYNSVGTFSSRFSRSVGMSPTMFRRHRGFITSIATDPGYRAGRSTARLSCRVRLEESRGDMLVFLGLFTERIPEGRPVKCAVLRQPGHVLFEAVPAGTWYLLAQAVPLDGDQLPDRNDRPDVPVAVGTQGPLVVHANTVCSTEIVIRRGCPLDPPVLLALLDARRYAMSRLDRVAAPLTVGPAALSA